MSSKNETHSAVDCTQNLSPAPKRCKAAKRKWSEKFPPSWDNGIQQRYKPNIENFLAESIQTPLDAFLKLFFIELLDKTLFQTELYSDQRRRPYNFAITREELFGFFGVLILSGYCPVPNQPL